MDAERLLRSAYRDKLADADVPLRPDRRTPDEEQAAGLLFWAAQTEIALDAATLTRAAVEAR
jgi:hypothetical protein